MSPLLVMFVCTSVICKSQQLQKSRASVLSPRLPQGPCFKPSPPWAPLLHHPCMSATFQELLEGTGGTSGFPGIQSRNALRKNLSLCPEALRSHQAHMAGHSLPVSNTVPEENTVPRAREMAQWVQHLPCKHESLS